MRHLIASGYGYAGMLREAWGLEHEIGRQLKSTRVTARWLAR